VLKLEKEDPEVAYRACVALGNIVSMFKFYTCDNYQLRPNKLYAARDRGTALDPKSAQIMELRDVMDTIRSSFNDGRISSVVGEINLLAPSVSSDR